LGKPLAIAVRMLRSSRSGSPSPSVVNAKRTPFSCRIAAFWYASARLRRLVSVGG
jgi:hypothetical protein